jgi:hypothetical protein
MPRLSLYKPERGQDYKFIDRQISEMFQAGGTDVYIHKYMGPKLNANGTHDQPTIDSYNVTNIQDLLFLENRDRKYDTEIYKIRGLYNVQNIDFNLSQFGLFIDNDTLFMTVHINDFIKFIGRKPLSGDVLELPHLTDQFALGDGDISLPRYYVIEDVGRASEGFSSTWFPHLYRLKMRKITDSQQFADILRTPAGADLDKFVGDYNPATAYVTGQIVRKDGELFTVTSNTTGNAPPNTSYFTVYTNSIENLLSTRAKELEINDKVLEQAEADAPMSGYETRQFYTLAVDPTTGKPILERTSDLTTLDASNTGDTADLARAVPVRTGYTGYLVGDGKPSNGYEPSDGELSMFGFGIQFPEAPEANDFFLRTDFMPNRLFRFDGTRWVKIEDAVRMSMTNNNSRKTLKTGFINNTDYIYNDAVATDPVLIEKDAFTIITNITYQTALYLVLKLDTVEIAYTVADHSGIFTNTAGKLTITLPVIDSVQQKIPYTGTWTISLCNHREPIRQSLSKALKPRADL